MILYIVFRRGILLMLNPTKMSQLSNSDTINKMYAELNNELTKDIISKLKKYEYLIDYSLIDIKKAINAERKKVFNETLRKTRKLHRKTKKAIRSVYKEMSDALDDNRRNNK